MIRVSLRWITPRHTHARYLLLLGLAKTVLVLMALWPQLTLGLPLSLNVFAICRNNNSTLTHLSANYLAANRSRVACLVSFRLHHFSLGNSQIKEVVAVSRQSDFLFSYLRAKLLHKSSKAVGGNHSLNSIACQRNWTCQEIGMQKSLAKSSSSQITKVEANKSP